MIGTSGIGVSGIGVDNFGLAIDVASFAPFVEHVSMLPVAVEHITMDAGPVERIRVLPPAVEHITIGAS